MGKLLHGPSGDASIWRCLPTRSLRCVDGGKPCLQTHSGRGHSPADSQRENPFGRVSHGDLWGETSAGVGNQRMARGDLTGRPTARTPGQVIRLRVRADDKTEKNVASTKNKHTKKTSAQHPCNTDTGPPPSSTCYPSSYETEKHPFLIVYDKTHCNGRGRKKFECPG